MTQIIAISLILGLLDYWLVRTPILVCRVYLQAGEFDEGFLSDVLQFVPVEADGLHAAPEVGEAPGADSPQLGVGEINLLEGSQWRKLVGY